jgi:predicted N-acetyltransferase YhbS
MASRRQGRGVGRAAVLAAAVELAAVGCPALHVTYHGASDGPRAFYGKIGFVEATGRATAPAEEEASAVLRLHATSQPQRPSPHAVGAGVLIQGPSHGLDTPASTWRCSNLRR